MAAVDKGRIESARSFGVSEMVILKKLITPQALTRCHCATRRSCRKPTSGHVPGIRYRGYGHY